jgi:Flp pilus assembly protein TadG
VRLAHTSSAGARRGQRRERGAVLVELALAAPLLLILLFGIIDFGWAFTQDLDVKQGAREGSRLVAVNYHPTTATGDAQADDIIDEICRRIDGGANTTVTLQIPSGQSGSIGAVGQYASVEVARPATSLSGLFSPVLSGKDLHSQVETRLEVKATWASSNTARTKTCS